MENFENLQSTWNQQSDTSPKLNSSDMIAKASQNIKTIKTEHFWTIGILLATAFVLIFYFIEIFSDKITNKIKGLELMIAVLIIRIVLEIISLIQFRKIDFMGEFIKYTEQLVSFYKFRKITHFVLTPVIYILYFAGFISLLPLFKVNLSNGFYLYIQITGIAFLVIFSFFLFKILKKDLKNLEFFKNIQNNK
jgi:hypothetical protein